MAMHGAPARGARAQMILVAQEIVEQRVFTGGKRHLAAFERYLTRGRVEHDAGVFERRLGVAGRAPDDGAQASQQFGQVEGLGQVVVGAGVEAGDIITKVDGKTVVELDKLNEVYKVNGVDVLAKIKEMC